MEDFELLNKIGERLVDEHLNIKEENFRLQQIISNDYVISFVIDKYGFFILPNKKSLKIMGIHTKKLRTRNAFEFFKGNQRAIDNVRRALRGESFADVLKLDKKYWRVAYQPTLNEQGEIIGITGVSVDITDILKNASKILKELS